LFCGAGAGKNFFRLFGAFGFFFGGGFGGAKGEEKSEKRKEKKGEEWGGRRIIEN